MDELDRNSLARAATEDPEVTVVKSKKIYTDLVKALNDLVANHIKDEYKAAASFTSLLDVQTTKIVLALDVIQKDLDRINRKRNLDWLG